MTLLLTVGDATQLHQSSDYRLSNGGQIIETINGSKQLSVSSTNWTAQIAFTGIAWDGHGYHTGKWLAEHCSGADPLTSLPDFVDGIATEATRRLSLAKRPDRRLTIVIAAAETGACRLFVISNWELERNAPLKQSNAYFHWFERALKFPVLLVNGCDAVIPRAAKRHLIRLVQSSSNPKQIRHALAEVNRMAATDRKFANLISQQCWVHSVLNDGQSAGMNEGAVPGIAPVLFLGTGDLRAEFLRSGAPGIPALPVIVQSAGYRGLGTPLPPPIGERREIPYSLPDAVRAIGPSDEEMHARIEVLGDSGTLFVRKNEPLLLTLGTVVLELTEVPSSFAAYSRKFLELPNLPTIDGANPRSWNFPFDIHWDGNEFSAKFAQCSMAFRSSNLPLPLPHLGTEEEISFAAPYGGLTVRVTPESPRIQLDIVAQFVLRDFAEPRFDRRSI